MKKTLKIVLPIAVAILLIIIIGILVANSDKSELRTIKSEKQLLTILEGERISPVREALIKIATLPFSFMAGEWEGNDNYYLNDGLSSSSTNKGSSLGVLDQITPTEDVSGTSSSSGLLDSLGSLSSSSSSSTKEYSTTNIQVENVDEADIIKTDGDYIYSISDTSVIITNAENPSELKIESKINMADGSAPEELIIYNNKLVIIATTSKSTSSYYMDKNNTKVKIYDITQKDRPIEQKEYELYEPYYTSRCINNMLYVIASGDLREEYGKVVRDYEEDNTLQEIDLDNIKYLKDVKTKKQTLISSVDLNDVQDDIELSSYLIDISNAYVSEKAIYLLDEQYDNGIRNDGIPLSSLFGIKGVFGAFTYEPTRRSEEYGYYTNIYKFDILNDGKIDYNTKAKEKGKTINQYSLDELNNHLRIALYDSNGARVVIFDEKLNQLGKSDYVAKGETMYTSRFMGNKAYLVTYRNTDPLFVIDLKNEQKPKVLGKLEIPGYSTYLHPYDENHLIGIGMETKETVRRNAAGKVLSTTATIVGMKMALFDVSDVTRPVQISSTVIGDSRTTSAILTNPKALLFSKEKNLIAIPVNNYSEDFEITNSSTSYQDVINSYKAYSKPYVSEGYFVYNIDLENGFNLKGVVTHEKENQKSNYYTNYTTSKLLRGLYIDNNLYTVSETAVKVNSLDNLDLISEMKIK